MIRIRIRCIRVQIQNTAGTPPLLKKKLWCCKPPPPPTRDNINYIEERMAQLVPLSIPLRLTGLLAHCSDGLTASDLARLKAGGTQ